jgi:hypothetical protein
MPMLALEKSCADPLHVFPDGQPDGVAVTSQSWKQVRDPVFPRHVSPAAQCWASHSSPTAPGPVCTHPAVPSSFTTAQVVFPVHVPFGPPASSVHPRTGTQTGTWISIAVAGCTSQNEVLVTAPASIASPQVVSPSQQ